MRQNKPAVIDRFVELNDPGEVFKNPYTLLFMRTFINIVKRIANTAVYSDTAAPAIILQSPNGTAYRVTVDDAGTLQVVNARS